MENSSESVIDISFQIHQSLDPLTHIRVRGWKESWRAIIVLEVCGSMGASLSLKNNSQSKLELAKSCAKNIYHKRKDDERLGVLAFRKKLIKRSFLNFWII